MRHRAQKSRSFLRILRRLWPAPVVHGHGRIAVLRETDYPGGAATSFETLLTLKSCRPDFPSDLPLPQRASWRS